MSDPRDIGAAAAATNANENTTTIATTIANTIANASMVGQETSYQFDDDDSITPPTSPKQQHTQFLDLTNGEGGERQDQDLYEEEDDEDMPTRVPPSNGNNNSSNSNNNARIGMGGAPGVFGKVVETGQEHTGRWTKEEHEAFLSALHMYGKEWKKVAAKVKTRTVVQTRTHAQKYFQKLQKVMEGGTTKDEVSHVDMGVSDSSRKPSSQRKKRIPSIASANKAPRQSSVQSAAHLISHLSTGNGGLSHESSPSYSMPAPPASLARLAATTTTTTTQPLQAPQTSIGFPVVHGFSTIQPSTDFSTAFASSGAFRGDTTATATTGVPGSAGAFSMKIVAPDHDAATKRGKFPEPSPAACGKRKLAEIAAARMLAGVAMSGIGRAQMRAAAEEEDLDADVDGTATPPPDEELHQNTGELNQIPAPPLLTSGAGVGVGARKLARLSLQIVNPDSLGLPYEQQRRGGGDSPVTPWDGQLKALVSESQNKGAPKQESVFDALLVPSVNEVGYNNSSSQHAVCGPGSGYGRSSLHKAICDMDFATIQSELASPNVAEMLQRKDEAGFCPLHSACTLCMKNVRNSSIAVEIVRVLLSAGADVAISDAEQNTPLHWASRAGDRAVAELLLLKNGPQDAKNERGETPLHWAMRAGRVGLVVVKVLLENGARPSSLSKEFKRPVDIAAEGFHDQEGSVIEIKKFISQRKRLSKDQRKVLKDAADERKEARANLLQASVQSRTLVLHHPECLEHIPKASSDWEVPGRVTTMLDRLVSSTGQSTAPPVHSHEITISQEFDRAKLDLLSRVHSTDYLNFVNKLSKDLEKQQKERTGEEKADADKEGNKHAVVPFTPMVQRSMIKIAESSVKLGQHSDTSFSAGSLRAARRAAGAVQHAVDCVLVGRHRNAFCIVRPPGHHAGVNGLLDGGESCGFCIFNNVAAGAMHAISDERLLCERCAIVDIDVHHGNGTEEIVRKCHDPSKLFFFSIHLYDNERKGKRETKSFQYKFYPGTGEEDDVALNIINVPITPLWKENQAAPASAVHNTRHRAKRHTQDKDAADGDSSDAGTPKASDVEEQSSTKGISSGTSSPVPPNPAAATGGRVAYRQAIQNRLLPALRAFNPDLILISAGFDASRGDVGNAKHEAGGKERIGMDLEPEDYAWTTRKICEIADICCQGRVVSVLEGGYGRSPANSDGTASQPLDKTLLSECAVRHLHAMIDPYNVEGRFGQSNDP